MNKTVLLHVSGGDYSAQDFEKHFNPQEVYDNMIADGHTLVVFDSSEYYIEVRIYEFKDEVDGDFITYLHENFIDYDFAKHTNFYIVEGVK
ncbi:hypothetical protein Kirov_113 [Bacillus phage Kirov]|uniref:Uncharacterized protein n=1 Tax=Bacillus phage Kirov TaxID=2783539 RepID=A0A7U3NKI5_9CAUD|nr:hypothetical protein PQE67_gp191 [Bacillus phage Kirov]QOV08312.1 hypothetical protein Kirov_113 [Bacillus phage Kirov]